LSALRILFGVAVGRFLDSRDADMMRVCDGAVWYLREVSGLGGKERAGLWHRREGIHRID
jgi:sigma54-dependent transcription regulator